MFMLRRLAVACLALIALVPVAAGEIAGHAPSVGDCVRLTLVPTDSTEASADVYVSKSLPDMPVPWPGGNGDDDFVPLAVTSSILEAVIRFINDDDSPVQRASVLVQVEVVVPATDMHEGQRLTVAADVTACGGL